VIQRFESDPSAIGSKVSLTETNISRTGPKSSIACYISYSGASVSTVADTIATWSPFAHIK